MTKGDIVNVTAVGKKNIISKKYWYWDIINTELELAEQY